MDLTNRAVYGSFLVAVTLASIKYKFIKQFSVLVTALSFLEFSSLDVNDFVRFCGFVILGTFQYTFLQIDPRKIFTLLSIVWTSDISAYFIGNYCRGPRLPHQINSNKTYSGCFGGILVSACVGLFQNLTISQSFVISIAAMSGDLLESYVKRLSNVKDSGNGIVHIPGHGGVLDRVDSLIVATPFAYWILK